MDQMQQTARSNYYDALTRALSIPPLINSGWQELLAQAWEILLHCQLCCVSKKETILNFFVVFGKQGSGGQRWAICSTNSAELGSAPIRWKLYPSRIRWVAQFSKDIAPGQCRHKSGGRKIKIAICFDKPVCACVCVSLLGCHNLQFFRLFTDEFDTW